MAGAKPGPKKGSPSNNLLGAPKVPWKFKEQQQRTFLEHYARTHRWQESATKAGVSDAAVRGLVKRDARFAAEVDRARDRFFESIDQEVHRRGISGWKEPRFIGEKRTEYVTRFSDACLLAYAKRHMAEYRDRIEAPPPAVVRHEVDFRNLASDERKMFRQLAMKQIARIEAQRKKSKDAEQEPGE